MSQSDFAFRWSFTVGASALNQYELCKTPAGMVVTAAVTDEPIGIVQDGAAASSLASFVLFGRTFARGSAAIAVGAFLMPNATGEVTTHNGDVASVHCGVALAASGAANEELEIFLCTPYVLAQA